MPSFTLRDILVLELLKTVKELKPNWPALIFNESFRKVSWYFSLDILFCPNAERPIEIINEHTISRGLIFFRTRNFFYFIRKKSKLIIQR
ncbi:hypothetical protein EGI31_04865 [Lacihabitans soyangensis]|uniref:Uncharacterized protein n=1 Tax=Lacihabitans soyangensis TaxID=869394 RepID=A0AAE3KRJ3_9BACT|nr:hypothetical protein [Lacihabitans soyangensis]